jgi:hypothetical protein
MPRSMCFVATAILFGSAVLAGQTSKPSQKWSYEDAYRILTDSPWAPAKGAVQVEFGSETKYLDPYSGIRTTEYSNRRSDALTAKINPKGSTPLPAISVLWWSSKTIRLAQMRVDQFRGKLAKDAPLQVERLEQITIVVEGSESLRILRDAGPGLKESVYIELPGSATLEPVEIKFHEGENAGEDYVAFEFLRERNGEPTIPENTPSVIFYCKAESQKPEPGRSNSLALHVTFRPVEMRANGQPDL